MTSPAADKAPLIDVEDVHTFYGKSHVLHGVCLQIGRGEVVGLLGRNGVGKSTTLKTIIGLVAPSRGKVRFEGAVISGMPAHRLARIGIAYVPEDRRIFRLLTVMENLRTGLDRRGVTDERKHELLEKVFVIFPFGGTAQSGRRHALRRRAANAGNCPRDDARAEDHSAG